MKMQSIIRLFIIISGVLLFLSAAAKFISANGNAGVLQQSDPILSISFRHLFWIVGSFELIVATVCILEDNQQLQATSLACLSTGFMVYRLGMKWVHYYKPCPCLGSLTDALRIPPETADTVMQIILAYLLIGSYATLLCLRWQRKKMLSINNKRNSIVGGFKEFKEPR
jgi:hypothetical protein